MSSLPPGTSANLHLPPPLIEIGYGLLLTKLETYRTSYAMKNSLSTAKAEGARSKDLPNPSEGSIGLASWFFKVEFPELSIRNYQFNDEETGSIEWSFAVISRSTLAGETVDDILKKYAYALPEPEGEVLEMLETFRAKFAIADSIDWKYWS